MHAKKHEEYNFIIIEWIFWANYNVSSFCVNIILGFSESLWEQLEQNHNISIYNSNFNII